MMSMIRRIIEYSRKVQTCGFLPDPPTPRAMRRLRRMAKVIAFIQVGKIKIIGRENLDTQSSSIVIANHPHFADIAAVIPLVINRPARYMIARGVMRFGFGLGALLCGPMGGFSVDLDPGKGKPAKDAAVQLLTKGETLVMFPEGWSWPDGKIHPFKKGAVRIAKEARTLGQNVSIIPIHLKYGRYPGPWINKFPISLQFLLLILMFWWYRRGVTAIIGKPIPISEMPNDDAVATEILRQHVVDLGSTELSTRNNINNELQ